MPAMPLPHPTLQKTIPCDLTTSVHHLNGFCVFPESHYSFFYHFWGELFQMWFYIADAVEPPSCVQLFVTLWTSACQASLSFIISWSLLKLTSIELVMLSNHLTLCCPLLLLPSVSSSIRVLFSNESVLCIRWPKYWSLSRFSDLFIAQSALYTISLSLFL